MQQKKSKVVKEIKDYIKLLPIGLILIIVPIIVYLKEVKLDSIVATYWKGSIKDIDFFSYYKVAWFIALTCIAVLFSLFYVASKKIKLTFPKIFFPLAIYLIFVFLSSSLSKFHNQAFFGFPDRYEGFFTILCYILICFLCSILINSKFDIKYLITFLALSVLVVSIIGFTQFFGFDFLQTGFGKSLMLPSANQNLATALNFKFPEKYIYSTLYNPNYVGGFFAMILPICLVLFISTKISYQKILYGLFCILSFICLLGSKSTTGYISTVIAGIVMLIFLRRDLKRNLFSLITIIVCFGITTAVMNYTSGGVIFTELGLSKYFAYNNTNPKDSKNDSLPIQNVSMNSNTTGKVKFQTLALHNISKEETNTSITTESGTPAPMNISNSITTPAKITDIKIDKNDLFLYVSNEDALVIKYDSTSTQLLLYDSSNKAVEFVSNNVDDMVVLTFNDMRFQNIKISIKNTLLAVEAPNTTFNLVITAEGFKFVTPSGQMNDIMNAESFGFKGHEKWGSYRGYIWSRTIPMLKDTILIGHGPDTYAMYFPQNDYVGKMNHMDNIYIFVDKPHNMYLQIASNTGILSLIAFLVFAGWYCISSFKLYFKGGCNDYYVPGIACLVAVCSYLVSSMANDSTISVSPVFWILLGIGIASNRLYLKELLTKSTTKQNVNNSI